MSKERLLLEVIAQDGDSGGPPFIERHIEYVAGANSGTTEGELL